MKQEPFLFPIRDSTNGIRMQKMPRNKTSVCTVQCQGNCLIKSIQPLEKLNLDFKGLMPSTTKNHYFLTIIGNYTRFPFAFPFTDMTSLTVINGLTQLFSIFGTCAFIHLGGWSSFQAYEVKSWLLSHGAATNQTTSCNPWVNGHYKKSIEIIWKAILRALKSRRLPVTHMEHFMTDALHSTPSLLCSSVRNRKFC